MKKVGGLLKEYWGKSLLVVLLGVSCWGFSKFSFPKIDAFIRDALQNLNSISDVKSDTIVTLNIDITQDDLSYPHTAKSFSRLLNALQETNPKYILLAMEPLDLSRDEYEKKKIASIFLEHKNLYLNGTDSSNNISSFKSDSIFSNYPRFINYIIVKDYLSGAKDHKSRRAILKFTNSKQPTLTEELINLGITTKDLSYFKYSWEYWETTQVAIKSYPSSAFGNYSSHNLLNKNLAPDIFKDKIVIVGAHDEFSFLSLPSVFNITNKPSNNIFLDTEPYQHTVANLINFHITGDYIKVLNINDLYILFPIFCLLIILPSKPTTQVICLISTIPLLIIIEIMIYSFGSFYIDFSRSIVISLLSQYFILPVFALVSFKKQEQQKQKEITKIKIDTLFSLSEKLAHDIRSPLSSIKLMLYKTKFLSEEHKNITDQSIKKIEDITNNFLEKYSTHYSGQTSNDPINATQMISLLIQEKRVLMPDISFCIDTKGEDHLWVKANKNELQRLLNNILDNSMFSLKTTQKKNITIRMYKESQFGIIEIQDSGVGISKEILAFLGKARFTNKPKGLGNGIGILHASQSIQAMGGSLNISSELDIGTIVQVKLPLK